MEISLLFDLEEAILNILPDINPECTVDLKCHLQQLGVTKEEDLCYVTAEDLTPSISKIQARKLVAAWCRKGKDCAYQKTQM